MDYQVVIIGAGLSGLAAGIRLAHFGAKVLIVEAHSVCGGLNSYYRRNGRLIDVGLHAMTNFVPRGARGFPLTKLLRQLRIGYEELGLIQQTHSRIDYPSCALTFTNEFNFLRQQVAQKFPDQLNNFNRLADAIDDYDEVTLDPPNLKARKIAAQYITDPLLVEMLFAPIMYYGNSAEDDMDFAQFAIMCKSIYQQGFCRPEAGMKHVIDILVKRYEESGGELRLRTGVKELRIADDRVKSILLSTGEEITAEKVLSSAGYIETMRLCSDRPDDCLEEKVGRLSFVELVVILDIVPQALAVDDTIIFFNNEDRFTYRQPTELVDTTSGVICSPNNFQYRTPPADGMIRVTAKASYPLWRQIVGGDHPRQASESAQQAYAAAKRETREKLIAEAIRHVPDFREHIVFVDLFTPLTIKRFSRHLGGAVYGCPEKFRKGTTPMSNLFLCGTDQGFLGIVGSMLSGISMANMHCLQ